ncbi:MAG: hypothetical protein KatS3mg051_1569 [Anaerolineae bacterium]|nr:MAG: hypothetical protein KatS3mg051_1569 [Anaerolineae bacterium]
MTRQVEIRRYRGRYRLMARRRGRKGRLDAERGHRPEWMIVRSAESMRPVDYTHISQHGKATGGRRRPDALVYLCELLNQMIRQGELWIDDHGYVRRHY